MTTTISNRALEGLARAIIRTSQHALNSEEDSEDYCPHCQASCNFNEIIAHEEGCIVNEATSILQRLNLKDLASKFARS